MTGYDKFDLIQRTKPIEVLQPIASLFPTIWTLQIHDNVNFFRDIIDGIGPTGFQKDGFISSYQFPQEINAARLGKRFSARDFHERHPKMVHNLHYFLQGHALAPIKRVLGIAPATP
jgi:hypothetical protein